MELPITDPNQVAVHHLAIHSKIYSMLTHSSYLFGDSTVARVNEWYSDRPPDIHHAICLHQYYFHYLSDVNAAMRNLKSIGDKTKSCDYNASLAIICSNINSYFTYILECSVNGANTHVWKFLPFFKHVDLYFAMDSRVISLPPVFLVPFVEENDHKSQLQVPTADLQEIFRGDVAKLDVRCETSKGNRTFYFMSSGDTF